MNPLTDFLFTFTWFALFVVAVRSIVRGWQIGSEGSSPMGIRETRRTVTKAIHPEMRDVKDASKAANSIITAVIEGELTPIKVKTCHIGLIDSCRRTLELTVIGERL